MAFQSTHTVNTSYFKQPNNGQSNFRQKRDRLIQVTGYDLERGVIKGVTSEGYNVEASVDPVEVARGRTVEAASAERSAAAPYLGHSVDAKMRARIIPGKSFAILEGSEVKRKLNRDGETIRLIQCNRITDGGTSKKKVFEALITVEYNSRYKQATRLQCWEPEAVDINNKEGMQALYQRADDTVKFYNTHVERMKETSGNMPKTPNFIPYLGVELRAILTPEEGDVVGKAKTINLSGRMERMENGDILVPMDAEALKKNIQDYKNYVMNKYPDDIKSRIRIEASSYISYPVGQYNDNLMFRDKPANFYSPMYQMATAQSRLEEGTDGYLEGSNYGGWGVVTLSKDKIDTENDRIIPSYYIRSLFMSNTSRGFIHRKIRDAEGGNTDLDDALKGPVITYAKQKGLSAANSSDLAQAAALAAIAPPDYENNFSQSDDSFGYASMDIPFDEPDDFAPSTPKMRR